MTPHNLHAHGKFLLTGEYLVLQGARALAAPLSFGQQLRTEENSSGLIQWKSFEYDTCWLDVTLQADTLRIITTNLPDVAQRLVQVLTEARELNPFFLEKPTGLNVEIHADFNLNWGLGSSSTLIYLIAEWAGVNPYILLRNTFGGSGYDIACAGSASALFYTLTDQDHPAIEPVKWQPDFYKNIFFVYLGRKMNSRSGMAYFKEHAQYTASDVRIFSELAEKWAKAATIEALEDVVNEHEERMAHILKMETAKKKLFHDYPYSIKSLGAWGGDFIMATTRNENQLKAYFSGHKLETVFRFDQIILP